MPLDSVRNEVGLFFGGGDEWKQGGGFCRTYSGPWHEIKDNADERGLENLTGILLDGVMPFDLDAWDAFVRKHDSIPLSFSCTEPGSGIRCLFSSGTTTDAKDHYIYRVETVRRWRDTHGPFVCLRPAREWNGLRAEYVFVEKTFMRESFAIREMQAMSDDLVSRCPSLKVEKVSPTHMRVRGARFRANIEVLSDKGVHGACVAFYNHVPRRETRPWEFSAQCPYLGTVVMEAPCTCTCVRTNPRRWNARCRAWLKNGTLDELEAARAREAVERSACSDNFAFLKKELPVPSLEWGDPDGDEKKMEAQCRKIRDARREEEWRRLREEHLRQDREKRAQWEIDSQKARESAQLGMVESNRVAFANGDAEAGLRVSYYHTAYALKLSRHGKNEEAIREARKSLEWTRRSADAGSARAQSILGRWLLEGGTGRHMYGGCWSGFMPKVPAEGPYVSPLAIQGLSLPPDFLLCETNGVKTFCRIYRRDPERGVRYVRQAAMGDEPFAKSWIAERETKTLPLWMPEWWLAKDGFVLPGRKAVSEVEKTTRIGPGWGVDIQRRIGYDAEGRVVSVSDEHFADSRYAAGRTSPWHETNETCVVREVLP